MGAGTELTSGFYHLWRPVCGRGHAGKGRQASPTACSRTKTLRPQEAQAPWQGWGGCGVWGGGEPSLRHGGQPILQEVKVTWQHFAERHRPLLTLSSDTQSGKSFKNMEPPSKEDKHPCFPETKQGHRGCGCCGPGRCLPGLARGRRYLPRGGRDGRGRFSGGIGARFTLWNLELGQDFWIHQRRKECSPDYGCLRNVPRTVV